MKKILIVTVIAISSVAADIAQSTVIMREEPLPQYRETYQLSPEERAAWERLQRVSKWAQRAGERAAIESFGRAMEEAMRKRKQQAEEVKPE